MPEARTIRRLAAILAADVVGYSRMMAANETGTLSALKRHRETVFDPAVSANSGRVFKLIGDGTLVEFASVVDAVNCALAIQRAIATDTSEPKITLRIGVNLGDIIIEGDDVYGDGVNVAARLEPLAEPGGVCVASIVNESVGNRIDVAFRDGGDVQVKNIDRPIRVWKWHPETGAGSKGPPPVMAVVAAKPTRPSIAVLPFNNMSGDPEQEYFSDGITEDIITDLSKVAGLLVIARNSSFAYKGKSFDIRTVGRELGVKTALEGSIRRAGNRVRITAQLIDAETGGHLWAERYDRDLTDIFAVQDEVTHQIVAALKVTLTPAEKANIADTGTTNVAAHDAFLQARELTMATYKDRQAITQAMALFNQSIALDPDYGAAYAGLAMAHNIDFQNHFTDRSAQGLDIAIGFIDTAIAKSPNDAFVRFIAAVVTMFRGDLERAAREVDAALALNPNHALALAAHGSVDIYLGNPLEAIPYIERCLRLDPGRSTVSAQQFHFLGTAYLTAGKYEAAAAQFRERIAMSPRTDLSRAFLASALGHLGQMDEARAVWRELKEINPNYSFERHIGRLPFRKAADVARIKEGLTRAGLPD